MGPTCDSVRHQFDLLQINQITSTHCNMSATTCLPGISVNVENTTARWCVVCGKKANIGTCQVTGSQLSVLYFSVANTTSPYDCSIYREDPKCQIITADVLIINNYCQCLGSLLGVFSMVGR